MPSEMRAIRSRLDFSKIPTSIQIPNLIEVQRRSYERFLQMDKLPQEREDNGLQSVFTSVFPITDFRNVSELEFVDFSMATGVQVRLPQGSQPTCARPAPTAATWSSPTPSTRAPSLQLLRNLQQEHPRLLHQVRRPCRLQLKYDQAELRRARHDLLRSAQVTIRLRSRQRTRDRVRASAT